MDGFELKYGFPPGDNQALLVEDGQRAVAALTDSSPVATDLVTFYRSIHEVVLADVGNGYWIDSVDGVLVMLAEYGPVHVGEDLDGLVIGSDGGGWSYVVATDGTVWRTQTATWDEHDLDLVADDLRLLLELLEHSVTRFIATGEPGFV
ncbi:SMI1/KNR4 family protein [Streptomyces parvus]|uniref:SMI1/KNR4 family protein n=1 Tax=Streptomyces parvus TaxID=66428 RepID=UPI003664459C